MKLWRIATETRDYAANDLSGGGSARNPGRWNAKTEAVVYCAPSIALCALETTAYIDAFGLPLNKFLVEINVPDSVWNGRQDMSDPAKLPGAWNAIPAGATSVAVGSAWLAKAATAILLLPSVIVPEEAIALINPKHADARSMTAKAVRRFEYDTILRTK